MKKMLLSITAALLCALLLVSCAQAPQTATPDTQADTTADTDTSNTQESGKLIVNSEGTEFIVIVPEDAKTLYDTALNIKSSAYAACSKNIYVKYDGSATEQDCEILIGMTNRAESAQAAEGLAENEYRIVWINNKLVVAGGTNYAARLGAKWLCDTYFEGATGSAIYVPENIDQKGSVSLNLNFSGLKTGWNSLVYPATNNIELQYQIYMPANYDANKEYPCILYMHSAGVRCDDNSHIYAGEAKFLRNLETSSYKNDVIVIAPCCPKTDKWVPAATWNAITYDFVNTEPTSYMVAATELFNKAREGLSIDDSRLYLYGMSMGGFATWDLLTRNPNTFAAAIPVAGAGDPTAVSTFDGTAIWIFHGTADEAVPYASGKTMYDALIAAGRNDVKLTTFDGAGHGIWSMTADTEGLFDWLFAQKRAG